MTTISVYKKFTTQFSHLLSTEVYTQITLGLILATLPLDYAFGSISCMLFLVFVFIKHTKFQYKKSLLYPILFYLMMCLSIFWTTSTQNTLQGLQKELMFLLLPIGMFFLNPLSKNQISTIIRFFSFTQVLYALFCMVCAVYKYLINNELNVFLYENLISDKTSVVYISTFVLFSLFYFISIPKKLNIDIVSIIILSVFVLLLGSKTILFIGFLLLVIYYLFYSGVAKNIRGLTFVASVLFLTISLSQLDETREKLFIEFETAFVDSTKNDSFSDFYKQETYNVSLSQAWNLETFGDNYYFPGAAFRVYNARVYFELLEDQPHLFFTGFGLQASQDLLKEKAKYYNLYLAYGDLNFHNQYLQTLAELGILGLLILVVMLGVNLKNAIVNQDFLHLIFAILSIILFLTESVFCRQRGILFFIVLYCLFNSVKKVPVTKKTI